MALNVFGNILKQAQAANIQQRTTNATEWLRDKASSVRTVNTQRVIQQNTDRYRTQLRPGQLYLFRYEAKLKDSLPYHDRFPLLFPIKRESGGFYGLNMHYLPLEYRAILMDNLYGLINNQNYDETTKLRLSYDLLNGSAKFRYFRPCLKRYLNKQVQSKFVYIDPKEWDVALFLPLHRFQGATAAQVHKDSRKIIRGR